MERAFKPARRDGSIWSAASGAASISRRGDAARAEIRRMLPPWKEERPEGRRRLGRLDSSIGYGCQRSHCDILGVRRSVMRLHVLGSSGGYPVPDNPCSGFLLEHGEARLWIDAGNGTMAAVQRILPLERI